MEHLDLFFFCLLMILPLTCGLCMLQATLLGFVKHILEQTGPGWTMKFLQRFESNKMAI